MLRSVNNLSVLFLLSLIRSSFKFSRSLKILAQLRKKHALAVATVPVMLLIIYYVFNGLQDDKKMLFNQVTQHENMKKGNPTFNLERNLLLVSYNLWCTLWHSHGVEERIESLVEGIKDFDIALIQEAYIWNFGVAVFKKCASLLVVEMKKHGFHFRTSILDFVPPFGQSGGVVIFSRIPLVRTISKQYNSSIFQYLVYRGFVVGEFFINSKPLHVINTHLNPTGVDSRVQQAKELARAMKDFNLNSHFVVAGDFNIDNNYPTTSNSSTEFRKLLETMSETGLHSVFPVRMETNIDGGNYDAMFISSNVAVVRKEIIKLVTKKNKFVSDHFGLAVELKLL